MPQLPPPEVELKGTIPRAAEPDGMPPLETVPPAAEPMVPTEMPPTTTPETPPPPPLIAAPKPVQSTAPPAAAAPGPELLPREFQSPPKVGAVARLPDPAKLKGLEPAAMQALLGVPDLLRWESHAQVYQYRAAKCVLNIIFYEDPAGGPFQAFLDRQIKNNRQIGTKRADGFPVKRFDRGSRDA